MLSGEFNPEIIDFMRQGVDAKTEKSICFRYLWVLRSPAIRLVTAYSQEMRDLCGKNLSLVQDDPLVSSSFSVLV